METWIRIIARTSAWGDRAGKCIAERPVLALATALVLTAGWGVTYWLVGYEADPHAVAQAASWCFVRARSRRRVSAHATDEAQVVESGRVAADELAIAGVEVIISCVVGCP
jgi:hypothetical protein